MKPYKLGKTEVTYKLWKEVYDWATQPANGYKFANAGVKGKDGSGSENEPVTKVNWRDCIVWCNAYTQMKAEVVACELNGLPAPIIRAQDYSTVVVLLAPRRLANMSKEERIWSLYIHACIQYVNNDYMTNKSVRKRFGIEDSNYPQASRLIKLVIDSGLVKEKDVNSSKKDSKYVPFWV